MRTTALLMMPVASFGLATENLGYLAAAFLVNGLLAGWTAAR